MRRGHVEAFVRHGLPDPGLTHPLSSNYFNPVDISPSSDLLKRVILRLEYDGSITLDCLIGNSRGRSRGQNRVIKSRTFRVGLVFTRRNMMELRRVAPFREGYWDKAWTRWDKMGAGIMAQPKPRAALDLDKNLCLDPSVRVRDDGLLYNSATDEFFQADSEMIDLLKRLTEETQLQQRNNDPDARIQEGIRLVNGAGLLVRQTSN